MYTYAGVRVISAPLVSQDTLTRMAGHLWYTWTTGIGCFDWDALVRYSHHITLFVPAYDRDAYLDITGYDGWDAVTQCLQLLPKVSISTLVRPDTIGQLPDFCTWAIHQNTHRVFIHYRPDDLWSTPDAIAYSHRYHRYKQCRVIPLTHSDQAHTCLGVPSTRRDWLRWAFYYLV